MTYEVGYWVDLFNVKLSEDGTSSWIQAFPLGKYQHPVFGEINVTSDRVQRMADGVKNKVRGQDLDINYDHNLKTTEAAGWVKDAEARTDGLWLFVEWTKDAFEKIKSKAFRYFSPEFTDEWVHPGTGQKFTDVLFGGGLTNRPFLKGILPINLSELTFPAPASTPEPPPTPKEGEVDLKELRKLLGLAEDATEEQVTTKLTELAALNVAPPAPPAPPTPPAPPEPPMNLSEELRSLAENNPTVKTLIDHVEAQTRGIVAARKELREERIATKLTEFDQTKIAFTPAAKDLAREIVLELSDEQGVKFWSLLDMMKTSQSLFVELGERAGGVVRYTHEKDPREQFAALTEELVAKGMKYPDAVEKVSKDNPQLYNEYREASFAFKTA